MEEFVEINDEFIINSSDKLAKKGCEFFTYTFFFFTFMHLSSRNAILVRITMMCLNHHQPSPPFPSQNHLIQIS